MSSTDSQGNPWPPPSEVHWPAHGPLGYLHGRRQLGRSATLGGASTPFKSEEILLQCGGPDELSDSLAGLVGITLGYEDANETNAATPLYAQAIVEWGTAGVQHQLICDFLRGTLIPVNGASFRVRARLAPIDIESGEPPGIPAESAAILSATIGYWGGCCRPQLTLQAIAQDFGEGIRARYRIPRFAHEFTSITSGNAEAFWKTAEGLGNALGSEFFDSFNRMPIPGMAQYLEIGGAPPGNTVTTVFYLQP